MFMYVVMIGKLIAPVCTAPLGYMHHCCSHLSGWLGEHGAVVEPVSDGLRMCAVN